MIDLLAFLAGFVVGSWWKEEMMLFVASIGCALVTVGWSFGAENWPALGWAVSSMVWTVNAWIES